jgi:hypothetical protein
MIILLNGKSIETHKYLEEKENGKHKVSMSFYVSSEEYHEVTTLLYKGSFNVEIPKNELRFHGSIQKYSTSVTNLYEKGQVGEFELVLLEA